jgi:hypothetical protein
MCDGFLATTSKYRHFEIGTEEVFTILKNIMQPYYEVYRNHSDRLRNQEFQRMNWTTYQYTKCVMTLPRANADETLPDTGDTLQNTGDLEGNTVWFLQLWNTLRDEDKPRFEAQMGRLLRLTRPHDFVVSVRET